MVREIIIVAVVLSLVGAAALYRQRRSSSSGWPRHGRWAGRIGLALAGLSLIAGVGLLGYAVSLGPLTTAGAQDAEARDVKPIFARFTEWIDRWTGRMRVKVRKPALSVPEAEKVVDRLIAMGYLRFVPESQRADVRRQLVETAVQGYLDSEWTDECVAADLRGYPADNEDLAEGQVGATIRLMRPALERDGVELDSVVDELGDERYEVVIIGQRHLIYESDGGGDGWVLALKRLLEIVNGLLEQAGSSERLYGIYGGNDGRVILLTPEMHDYIESLGDVLDSGWMPYPAEAVTIGTDP